METLPNKNILFYLIRFSVIFVIAYFIVSPFFLNFQRLLPENNKIALELYQPFRAFGLLTLLGQFIRGLAFALVFYPFRNLIFEHRAGKLLLFTSMFGLGLFGSVEPQPGSIEGIIYTVISLGEHFVVLVAVAIQMLIFIWLFFRVETIFYESLSGFKNKSIFLNVNKIYGYTLRFIAVHLFTYMVIGGLFYEISGYNELLESMEIFILWRPLENLHTVLLVFFGQIFRGTFFALLLYPFYRIYIYRKRGWALLFILMAGLAILGSPLFVTEIIAFEGTLVEFFSRLTVGIPEIFSQMIVFSLLFFYWQRYADAKQSKSLTNNMCLFLT